MNQPLHLDPQALHHAIGYYTHTHDTLEHHYNTALNTAEYLYGPAWSGQSADSHRAAFTEWSEHFRNAITTIAIMRGNLHNAYTDYTNTEQHNATTIADSTTTLP